MPTTPHELMQLQQKEYHRVMSPRIVYLVVTVDAEREFDVAPISNVTSVSTEPQRIVAAVYKEWRTCKNLLSTPEFSISIPSADKLTPVWLAAHRYAKISIPESWPKIDVAGFSRMPATSVPTPLLFKMRTVSSDTR